MVLTLLKCLYSGLLQEAQVQRVLRLCFLYRQDVVNRSGEQASGESNMKTIGLLGGMSWESTLGYYRAINRGVAQALGGLHSARIALYSVDFAPVEEFQRAGDWPGAAAHLTAAALKIQAAGAD